MPQTATFLIASGGYGISSCSASQAAWKACTSDGFEALEPGRVVAHRPEGVYVSCGAGVLQITELQFAGRKRCSAAQALNSIDLGGRMLGARA